MSARLHYQLFLMRHGESPAGPNDFERPLTDRGRKGARACARALQSRALKPEIALVSPALRCRETWARLAPLTPECSLVLAPSLYGASVSTLLEQLLTQTPSPGETVLLLAHNPGISDLAAQLTGAAPLSPGDFLQLKGEGRSWEAALYGPWRLEQRLDAAKLLADPRSSSNQQRRVESGPLATPIPQLPVAARRVVRPAHFSLPLEEPAAPSPLRESGEWEYVGPSEALQGGPHRWRSEREERDYVLTELDGEWRLFVDSCPHRGLPLSGGTLRDGCLVCPFHHWSFRLEDGLHTLGSGVQLEQREIRLDQGALWAKI